MTAAILLGILFGPIIISPIHGAYMDYYGATGRHHFGPSDLRPTGQVWLHDGEWWTFTRLQASRVPREFGRRSNPLDYELEFDEEPWPVEVRRFPCEREY